MHRIVPALFSLLVLAAACTDDGGEVATDDTPTTTAVAEETTITTAEATTTEAPAEETTTTEAPVEEETTTTEAAVDETAAVCDAYLTFLTPATLEAGIDSLVEILGADAPPGVQAGLDTLATGGGDDIEAYFEAVNNVEGYVRPICAERFAADVIPSPDAATAANQFLFAVMVGEEPVAQTLATADVVVQFDWNGYPDATMNFNDQNDTFTMILEPTVTVFCEVNNNVVNRCAFGE